MAYTAKTRRQIDFKVALTFPLCSLPLCFAHPDGTRRSTKKSQLMEIVLSYFEEVPATLTVPMDNVSAYMVDLMAMIRTIQEVPDTYEELARRLFQMLPVGYSRIDIVADTCQKISLKDQEREKRGVSEKVLIMSVMLKIPRNFSSFLKNGDNKTRLIELIKDYAVEHSQELLLRLKCNEILISLYKISYRLRVSTEADVIECLNGNQEEADTKLLLRAKHALETEPDMSIISRSHSGDVDINILFVCMFQDESYRIYLDYGMGKSRKVIKLSDIDMDTNKKTALIGFHAFTRNDYVSSIFRRSKAPVKRSQLFMQQRATFVVKKKFVPFDHLVVCCCIMLHKVCSRSKMFVEQMLCDRTFLLFSAMLHVVAFV